VFESRLRSARCFARQKARRALGGRCRARREDARSVVKIALENFARRACGKIEVAAAAYNTGYDARHRAPPAAAVVEAAQEGAGV
jgi:hypothetical protein